VSVIPDDWREIDPHMSNFDHEIDEGMEEGLKEPKTYSEHCAWDFHGKVWYDADEGVFKEEVWRYKEPVAVMSAPTLQELMTTVNDEWGWS
jgi:hypothetical protein